MSQTRWHALHIHRYGEQDEFLAGGLIPTLAELESQGAVHGFFFLRYWQGGPHLRVRLRLAEETAAGVLDHAVELLEARLRELPCTAEFDAEAFLQAQRHMADMEGEAGARVEPPDTVRRADYAPEYSKYGGPTGIALAEELFGHSSRVALGVVREQLGRPGLRLGTGFSMLVRALLGAGLPAARMAEFCAHYCRLWSPYVFDHFAANWTNLLAKQRAPMLAHAAKLLDARDAEDAPADPWAEAVRTAYVSACADDGVLDAVELAGADADRERRAQVLLASYVHTHNNRLGLIPEQEAFLGYLGHHVLAEYAGTSTQDGLERAGADYRSRMASA